MKLVFVPLSLLFSLFYPLALFSQGYWEFGQNKVQYRDFEWKVIETEKFNIIYYPGGEKLAKFAKCVLADVYDSLSQALSHNLSGPVPVIIYNSHNDFEQTNVTLYLIDEGTGGFTEIYKNRVVIPFDGSYENFRHVLAHEFTHVFQFNIARGTGIASILQGLSIYQTPLWFIEGMAEYFSLSWDAQSDMIIRDAVYWNKIKSIQNLYLIEGSYLMYKEGQSILRFIAKRYGEKKIGEIFKKARSIGRLNGAIKSVLGVDIEELNKLWMKQIKKEFWSQCINKEESPEGARRLTNHEGYTFNTAPSISPDGHEIVFLSDRDGYESLYLMSSIDGRIKAKLIGGGRTKGFESLHIMQAGIAWHPDSKLIAFVAKSEGKDILYVMDVPRRKIIKKFSPKLDEIFPSSFSPDGEFIAIRGVKDGAADIYLLNFKTEELTQLTDDIYDDLTPSWSPDGQYVIFSSDRPFDHDAWRYGQYALFKVGTRHTMSLQNPEPLLEKRATYIASPVWSSDSLGDKILFISNFDGVNNLYVLDIKSSELLLLTNVIGGIFTPSISANGELLVMSSYINLGWDIYLLKNPLKKGIEPKQERTYDTRYAEVKEDTSRISPKKLGLNFTPDWGGGAVAYSPGGSVAGYLRLAVSDLLGNHRFYLETASPENFLANYYLTYFYLPRRLDIGLGTFREEYYYIVDWPIADTLIWRKTQGAGLLFSYPQDRFHRIELRADAYKIEEELYLRWEGRGLGREKAYQVIPSLSWIYDNSLWGPTGPIDGRRGKLSLYSALPVLDYRSLIYNLYELDFRKYIRFKRRYSFATRLVNMGIWGEDANYIVEYYEWPGLGGPDGLRGYDIRKFTGRNASILNLELRYPFIDHLKIAFPIPLTIRGIRGVLFCDFGYAINDYRRFKFFENGGLKDLKFDFGLGIRIRFPYFVLKFDIAKNTNLISISKKTYLYLSLSPEF